MANQVIRSSNLIFMDTTDDRKLNVYISSNHPTTQIFDVNTMVYTPDWSNTNLTLTAETFLDSATTIPDKVQWYKQSLNNEEEILISDGDYTPSITIAENIDETMINTYICRVEYQSIQSFAKITFSRIDTGANGTIGVQGNDAVTFQVYSSNGYALSTNTPTVTLQTFAYIGGTEITAGATYQWYVYNNSWSAISGATMAYFDVSRDDVSFSKSYMCKMTFDGVEYTDVVTVDDMNDENKVFTVKPSSYVAGDLWIVGADYAPKGVEVGTLLRAEHTNNTYADSDWVTATKYDEKIAELKSDIDTYNQYFSFDSANGLKISARNANGTASKFSTSLTNEQLAFNYGDQAVAYINGTKMNIKEAVIESPLTVTGKYSGSTMLQAPVINIGKFSIVVESNGSLSIVANT